MRSTPAMVMLSFALAGCGAALPVLGNEVVRYRGLCDASAAVALDAEHFAVASDESNTLAIYRRGHADAVSTLDLAKFLGTPAGRESDLEGAAAIGNRIYWIASHGRNSAGELRTHRYRMFATAIEPGTPPVLAPSGRAYAELLDDLLTAESLRGYRLADAAKFAPEAPGGLNIEGLAATPDGRLLIGFRSPIPGGRALIVTLENPADIVAGGKARIGTPIELDLAGRGIRSIERVGDRYLVVAGPPGDRGAFALYRWSGKSGETAALIDGIELSKLRPEALFAIPGTVKVQVLSDDGGVTTNGVACKDRDRSQQSFRSVIIEP